MLYKVYSLNDYLGTFETDYAVDRLRDVLEKVFNARYLDFKSVSSEGFSNKYYVYRSVNQNFRDIKLLGTFETNFAITDMWDHIFKIFNGNNPDGIFVRKEKIC